MRSWALGVLILLAACKHGTPPKNLAPENREKPYSAAQAVSGTVARVIALNLHRDEIDLTGYRDLGAFHFRRLHFYTKENPGITVGSASVEQITLYFIDRMVVKIRYRLSEDASAFLADSLARQAGRTNDLANNWAARRQITWRYFSKTITYQNKCPEDDLANTLTDIGCDGGYWLYVELPGYRKKVKELEDVAKYVKEYLIDDPPASATPD